MHYKRVCRNFSRRIQFLLLLEDPLKFPFLLALILAVSPLACEEAKPPQVVAYFSPKDKVDAKLISLIEQETGSIKAAVYCLTHRGIIHALVEAKKRGVEVELIIDPFTVKARAPLKRMAQSGMSIFVWDPEQKSMTDRNKLRAPLMHNKFCVFGSQGILWTGSFNFTSEGALSNQENVVVLHDAPQARSFTEQFEQMKTQGCKSLKDYFAIPKKKKNSRINSP
jgi:phosphatidylserine/phosphatidylglycerophosphate/cardiolipin synthase-like enzyme